MTIGKSLLGDQRNDCELEDCTTDSTSDSGGLEIQATSSTLSAPVEGSDQIEITGSCKDLGRKNNSILVEVYAGEDEAAEPYFNNVNGNQSICEASSNPNRSGLEAVFMDQKSLAIGTSQAFTFTASGGTPPYTYGIALGGGAINAGTGAYTSGVATGTDVIQVTDATGQSSRSIVTVLSGITTAVAQTDSRKCFTVTNGIGLVDKPGLPDERTFPQCHNGRFGFTVRLGKVLVNPSAGQPNLKYMVRYKLQTNEGTTEYSTWEKVIIERNLTTPLITAAAYDPSTHKCTIRNSPARFNPGIFYTLNRTYTDILATNEGSTNLYANANTLSTTAGASVFEWDDNGVTDGVTYNYTLTSSEMNYDYPAPLTANSAVASCAAKRIYIKLSQQPVSGTCYLSLQDTGTAEQITTPNPNPLVDYEWGYSTTNASWIGVDGKANAGFVLSSCGDNPVCTQNGLAVGTYFFALRARNNTTGEIGIWSPIVVCQVTN